MVQRFSLSKSQDLRMVEVGKDFWRSPGPSPLLNQGHLDLVEQDCVQIVFRYPQEWRLHNLPGQPLPPFGSRPENLVNSKT